MSDDTREELAAEETPPIETVSPTDGTAEEPGDEERLPRRSRKYRKAAEAEAE